MRRMISQAPSAGQPASYGDVGERPMPGAGTNGPRRDPVHIERRSDMTRILGIAGSLRRESFNKAVLRAAQKLVPQGATLESIELDGIPLFNQDDEKSP